MKQETWYEAQFKGYDVPEPVKKRAVAIMQRFTIGGICDGMYIANCIAYDTGIGDGCGKFFAEKPVENIRRAAEFLQRAYGCNIFPEDIEELENIISTGRINQNLAIPGINRFIDRCKKEKKTIRPWMSEYLDKCIVDARDTLRVYGQPQEN